MSGNTEYIHSTNFQKNAEHWIKLACCRMSLRPALKVFKPDFDFPITKARAKFWLSFISL